MKVYHVKVKRDRPFDISRVPRPNKDMSAEAKPKLGYDPNLVFYYSLVHVNQCSPLGA